MQANPINSPCKVFVIYSREDDEFLKDLLKHLKILENNGTLTIWCDQYIDPGQKWEKEIVDKLDESEIILIFVSPDYYISEFIQKTEIVRAAQKHKNGEAIVIPVFVRHCAWKEDELISSLQGLLDGETPLADYDKNQRDKIFSQTIFGGMKQAAEQVKKIRIKKQEEREKEVKRKKQEEERGKEDAAWEYVLQSNTIPAYRAYLSEFSNGVHELEAVRHLKKLEYDEVRKKEDQLWSETITEHTPEAYQIYLNRYPDGIYKNIAVFRTGISELEPIDGGNSIAKGRYALLGIGLLGVLIGLFASSLFSKNQKQAPYNSVDEWSLAKRKSTIYAYQKIIYDTPNAANKREALDSLIKLEQMRDSVLADGLYYYKNGDKKWALKSFLKVRSIDSLNTKALKYLDSLGYK